MKKIFLFSLLGLIGIGSLQTVKAESQIYAALSPDGKTMTLYYDEAKSTRPNVLANWTEDMGTDYVDGATRSAVTSIVIDGSMADARPTRTYSWFYGVENATSIINLSDLHTDNVTNMNYMFMNCKKLTSLDLSHFNTANVENMRDMFDGCNELVSLNVSGFNTANVKYMSNMFYRCRKLQSLDLSDFNTEKVEDMSWMFYYCEALESLTIDNSQFNTANVTNMEYMFCDCEKLASLDVSGFNTEKVTTMERMFSYCYALTSLDLSGFKIGNVTKMDYMFYACHLLEKIYCDGDWSGTTATSDDMFYGCENLVGGNNTAYDENYVNAAYAIQDGLNGKPGYFTKKPVPQTKSMTPTWGELGWDELHQQWGLTSYELDASDNPLFYFCVGVDGVKETMPTSFVLSNSTDDNFIFADAVNPEDFQGVVKDAAITVTVDGSGYHYDAVGAKYYLLAKFSGEMSDADGNKLIVKEPANFIKLFVPSDVATGVDEMLKSSNTEILKFVRDGQILIIRDNKIYTLQGQEIE